MKQFKVAVIGAGLMAEEHIKAFADIQEISVVGIHSRTRPRAEILAQRYQIPQVYESIDSLYAGTQADLVIIAVKELSANEVCKQAFNFPWLALIEKPVGYNLVDAEDIAAAAKKVGSKAYVALNRRHYSSTRAVCQEIAGFDGQRLVHVFDQENPQVALNAGVESLVVENWMYANSIHVVDYLSIFCRGEVTEVEQIIKWDPKSPRFVLAKILYSSGDLGLYQAVWNGPGPWAVSVTTQAKRWEMRPLEQAFSQVYNSRKNEPIALHSWDTRFKPGLRQQAEETVKALRGEDNNLPTLEDGLLTMKLVSQIFDA